MPYYAEAANRKLEEQVKISESLRSELNQLTISSIKARIAIHLQYGKEFMNAGNYVKAMKCFHLN